MTWKSLSLATIVGFLASTSAFATSQDTPQVAIETSLGTIILELDRVHAPRTVDNFLRYVSDHHFDGTVVYRVVPGFVIQMGSYEADGTARPVHAPIPLEANNGLFNTRGAVAMARTGPTSAMAEFFIDLADNPTLDRHADDPGNTTGFAVFAHVVGGQNVVDRIAAVPLGDHGPFPGFAPQTPIVISKVSLLNAP